MYKNEFELFLPGGKRHYKGTTNQSVKARGFYSDQFASASSLPKCKVSLKSWATGTRIFGYFLQSICKAKYYNKINCYS